MFCFERRSSLHQRRPSFDMQRRIWYAWNRKRLTCSKDPKIESQEDRATKMATSECVENGKRFVVFEFYILHFNDLEGFRASILLDNRNIARKLFLEWKECCQRNWLFCPWIFMIMRNHFFMMFKRSLTSS